MQGKVKFTIAVYQKEGESKLAQAGRPHNGALECSCLLSGFHAYCQDNCNCFLTALDHIYFGSLHFISQWQS